LGFATLKIFPIRRFSCGKPSKRNRQAELFNEAEAGDTAEDGAEDDVADTLTETILPTHRR
jgi:DNA-directed RNA polymerase subunit N (RpoN/RPB10)